MGRFQINAPFKFNTVCLGIIDSSIKIRKRNYTIQAPSEPRLTVQSESGKRSLPNFVRYIAKDPKQRP